MFNSGCFLVIKCMSMGHVECSCKHFLNEVLKVHSFSFQQNLTDLTCEIVDNIHKVILTSYKPETKKLTFVNPGQQSKKN